MLLRKSGTQIIHKLLNKGHKSIKGKFQNFFEYRICDTKSSCMNPYYPSSPKAILVTSLDVQIR